MHDDDMDDMDDFGEGTTLPKPSELLAVYDVTDRLFSTLKEWFGVSDGVVLDVTNVDSAVTEVGDPEMIAPLAMRRRRVCTSGSRPS